MRKISTRLAAYATLLLLAQPAAAQGVYDMGVLTNTMTITSAHTNSIISNLALGEVARTGRKRPQGSPPKASAPERAFATRFPYQSTAATRREAIEAYLGRLQRRDPKTAAAILPELRSRNIFAEFDAVAARAGMSPSDAADVMAGFLIGGWEIITGRDADPAGIRGVRRQVAAQLATMAAMRDPKARTSLAEELKITTFILGAGAASAKRDGDVDRYRQGVAAFYRQQTGQDMGRMRITAAGFSQ